MPTTWIGIEHALDVFRKTKGRPTFIVLDSHIGYGSPHKQDTAAAHGEPLGDEEIRAHQTQLTAGLRTPSSWCPKASMSTSQPAWARAAQKARAEWEQRFSAYRAAISRARDRD